MHGCWIKLILDLSKINFMTILMEHNDLKVLMEGLTSSVFDGKLIPVKLEAHDFSRG